MVNTVNQKYEREYLVRLRNKFDKDVIYDGMLLKENNEELAINKYKMFRANYIDFEHNKTIMITVEEYKE